MSQPSPRRTPRRLTAVVLTLAFAAVPASAYAALPAVVPAGACTTPDGVTVVVDFTDLGGDVKTGCATAPATGTAALESAGFTETRDASSMICAIDAFPDPCPDTFQGSYWSYWFASPGGDWQAYQEGSDTAVPAPGQVEGWRYSDGSAGPTVTPPASAADGAGPSTAATAEVVASPEPSADATADPAPDGASTEDSSSATAVLTSGADSTGPSAGAVTGIGLFVLLAVAAAVVVRRRTAPGQHGPAGQD